MNWPFAIAGAIAVTVAVVHSVLGERWVFRRMRQSGAIPTNGGHVLREPHVRILWASWHIVSVFGLALAACLFYLGAADLPQSMVHFLGTAVMLSMLAGSLLVLVGTKGKHAGWLGLLLVAAFAGSGLAQAAPPCTLPAAGPIWPSSGTQHSHPTEYPLNMITRYALFEGQVHPKSSLDLLRR